MEVKDPRIIVRNKPHDENQKRHLKRKLENNHRGLH
jgi:hypothetical protein